MGVKKHQPYSKFAFAILVFAASYVAAFVLSTTFVAAFYVAAVTIPLRFH